MEHGKRAGSAVRERNRLRLVVASLPFLCPDCGSKDGKVEWNSGHRRYRLAVYHDGACPALENLPLKRSVDRFIRDSLVAHGYFLSDYNDHDTVGLHRAVPR